MTANHKRNTGPMLSSPRCGAKTRSGAPCRSPAFQSKKRCRMHGGAPGSGAPLGNKNALKIGSYTREAIAKRRRVQDLVRQSRLLIKGQRMDGHAAQADDLDLKGGGALRQAGLPLYS